MKWFTKAPWGAFILSDLKKQSRRVTRGGRREVSPALFQNLKKSVLILGKNALTRFIYGFYFSFKMLVLAYIGKKSPKSLSAGPVFRMLLIKYLSKCPYFQKLPLPWKIPGYAPAVIQRSSVKKLFLKVLQNSQENSSAGVSILIKLQSTGLQLY